MMIEPNLFYSKGKDIESRGYHDEEAKCFHLKAGSMGLLSPNLKKDFASVPLLKDWFEKEILPHTTSAGDDSHFYIQRDIHCYPINDIDELTVAASMVSGKHIRGDKVWKNAEGVPVKELKAKVVSVSFSETGDNYRRYEEATNKTIEMLTERKHILIQILSNAYHLKEHLGTKAEDRFVVPRQIDRAMEKLGFRCEEEKGYDLSIPEFEYTISDKTTNFLFHQNVSKKARTKCIKTLMMSNVHSGQSSETHLRPQFDCLLALQYDPFLVCGVTPYNRIVTNLKQGDGGWTLQNVPVDCFRFVLSPTEKIPPSDLTPETQDKINEFVRLMNGGFMLDLIDIAPVVWHTIQDNENQADASTLPRWQV